MRLGAFALLGALCLLGACSPYVQRGETLYHEERYVEAAEVFELTEPRLASSAPDVRAEYALYRGLTYLRLDDVPSAQKWLAYAYAIEQRAPETLIPARRALLARGWAECEQRASSHPSVAGSPDRVASTDSGALPHSAGPSANGRRAVTP